MRTEKKVSDLDLMERETKDYVVKPRCGQRQKCRCLMNGTRIVEELKRLSAIRNCWPPTVHPIKTFEKAADELMDGDNDLGRWNDKQDGR